MFSWMIKWNPELLSPGLMCTEELQHDADITCKDNVYIKEVLIFKTNFMISLISKTDFMVFLISKPLSSQDHHNNPPWLE